MGLKWTTQHLSKKKPRYQEEAENEALQRREHTPGWPHIAHNGNCLCLCRYCFSLSGCICRSCKGIGHSNCPGAERLANTQEHDKVRT